jgi:hypothetical protein
MGRGRYNAGKAVEEMRVITIQLRGAQTAIRHEVIPELIAWLTVEIERHTELRQTLYDANRRLPRADIQGQIDDLDSLIKHYQYIGERLMLPFSRHAWNRACVVVKDAFGDSLKTMGETPNEECPYCSGREVRK